MSDFVKPTHIEYVAMIGEFRCVQNDGETEVRSRDRSQVWDWIKHRRAQGYVANYQIIPTKVEGL